MKALKDFPDNFRAPVGVFDSGLGGLTVVKAIREYLPHEDIVYLGDTARVPYGTKSREAVVRFAAEDMEFLLSQGVKAVVIACNTASAYAFEVLKANYSVPLLSVIEPGCRSALAATRTNRIAVIGTEATIQSRSYEICLKAMNPEVEVVSMPCSLLVSLVEEGWIDKPATYSIISEYLGHLPATETDVLILGCTHYPLIKSSIGQVLGKNISLVDSAIGVSQELKCFLEQKHLNNLQAASGKIRICITDYTQRFQRLARYFLNDPDIEVQKVSVGELKEKTNV